MSSGYCVARDPRIDYGYSNVVVLAAPAWLDVCVAASPCGRGGRTASPVADTRNHVSSPSPSPSS
jgi:hypothetical protein